MQADVSSLWKLLRINFLKSFSHARVFFYQYSFGIITLCNNKPSFTARTYLIEFTFSVSNFGTHFLLSQHSLLPHDTVFHHQFFPILMKEKSLLDALQLPTHLNFGLCYGLYTSRSLPFFFICLEICHPFRLHAWSP